MREFLNRIFQHYGTRAILTADGAEKQIRVFFQGTNSKSWQNMEKHYCPLGQIPRGQYLCLLPAGTASEGNTLQVDGRDYRICRVEDMLLGPDALYQWGLCVEKGGEDTWALTE